MSFANRAKNIMFADPFTNRGKKAFRELGVKIYTPNQFFDDIYCPLFTEITDRRDYRDSDKNKDFHLYNAEQEKKRLEEEKKLLGIN